MAETSDLPQDVESDHVPGRGDSIHLDQDDHPEYHCDVTLLLHDPALDVWCARDEASGELMLIRLDADLNWQHVSLDVHN